MAKTNQHYPDSLNPFGSDEEQDESDPKARNNDKKVRGGVDYPEYLSPFGDDDDKESTQLENYDDSLNPFGEDDEKNDEVSDLRKPRAHEQPAEISMNPFDDRDEGSDGGSVTNETSEGREKSTEIQPELTVSSQSITPQAPTPQPDSLEPPKPLPRTKSLLKKEQALKQRQLKESGNQATTTESDQHASLVSTVSSNSTTSNTNSAATCITTTGLQPRKNKRNAPPVPINFKRQVSGSLEDIETELNEIGDKLAAYERESSSCQESLKATHLVNEAEFEQSRIRFIELIKSKNTIIRRQKELMYRKRELKLDQIYSDIEYELRMIGNKQCKYSADTFVFWNFRTT